MKRLCFVWIPTIEWDCHAGATLNQTVQAWKSGDEQKLKSWNRSRGRHAVLFACPDFHGLQNSGSLTPIRATQNTRRIAGRKNLKKSVQPCFPLVLRRSRCRNRDCCNSTQLHCSQAFACAVQGQDHGWPYDTSWVRGSETEVGFSSSCPLTRSKLRVY